jgi:hypothetical protein
MQTAIDCRHFADACTRLAQSASSEANKTALLSMASKWTGLATQAERIKQLVREVDTVFDTSGLGIEKARPRPRLVKAKVDAGSAPGSQAGVDPPAPRILKSQPKSLERAPSLPDALAG